MKKPAAVLMTAFILASAVTAQRVPNATRDSYRRALGIVKRAFEATGGAAADSVGALSFRLDGTLYARNQSYRPGPRPDGFAVSTSVRFDLRRERMIWEQSSSLPGGLTFASRSVAARASEGFNLNLERNNYTVLPANAPIFGQTARLVPAYFLKKILELRSTLRYAGRAAFRGRPHDLVSTVWNGQVFTLYFDAATGLLTKNETLAPDALNGDDVFEFVMTRYRTVGPLRMPARYEQFRSGVRTRDSEYSEIAIAETVPDDLFARPQDAEIFISTPFGIVRLSPDVYLANGVNGGGYRVLFVELEDGILVVDAPGNSQSSAQVIREIRAKMPRKPIKYLVLTHFHDDHSGGLREYVAEGATIVTTEANRAFFDAIARADHTLLPDALSRAPRAASFLVVEDERRFAQGIVVKNVRSPHAADMYVVYLPGERLVFQSDLYNWPDRAVTDSTVDLVNRIDELGWDVDRVISSHGGIADLAKIRREIREFK